MEPLTLKPRQPVKPAIECWDDDGDLQGLDDLQFRQVSSTTIGSAHLSGHRDSVSSHRSARSDRDSSVGGEEDWHVLLPTDDEKSTTTAIASAKKAGIPIPDNVPSSALLGGTIKRLGGRRIQKILVDDWGEDLELSKVEKGGLVLKKNDGSHFPEAIGQISADLLPSSPTPNQLTMLFNEVMEPAGLPMNILDQFRDYDEEDSCGDFPTIKVRKNRSARKPITLIAPPSKTTRDVEDIEEDLEFPNNGEPLRLSTQRELPKTPASQQAEDFDSEWAEGSLGTRNGGTRHDGRSNPSSSISAFSPSASSCLSAESEDEGLDGLVLPDGPIRFEEALKKRLQNMPLNDVEKSEVKPIEPMPPKDDFFTGIEIGDGDVFDSGKLTLNRNIKHKTARQTSPARRTAMTLTFTNKAQPGLTRIPKLTGSDRARPKLEPVSESGGPIPKYHRSQSRVGGHSAQPSLSSIPAPSTPSSSHLAAPATPSRRGLSAKSSRDHLRADATTNPAQYLKVKRSMPALRNQPSPNRSQQNYNRPPSRGELGNRQAAPSRPKSPFDRSGADSSMGISRKPPIPFLPAGTSHAQSHHINSKHHRQFNRPTSSDSNEALPLNRPLSRLSNPNHRPSTPPRKDVAPESLAREAAAKRTLTRPTRRRAFGDGSELEVFDDLPTSASMESKFVRQPARGGSRPSSSRTKLNLLHPNRSTTSIADSSVAATQTPLSPTKSDVTPRFARDTNASRLAREQRMGSVGATLHANPGLPTVREGGPLTSIGTNWKAHVAAKGLASPSASRSKRAKVPPRKPQLIKSMGDSTNTPKHSQGMRWNPSLFKWEGNENALAPFDASIPPSHSPKHMTGNGGSKAAPALIANVGASKGVQVVGGMVFDPQRMCWLKMAPAHATHYRFGSTPSPRSTDTVDEDEDPFAGLDDLDEGKDRKAMLGLGVELEDDLSSMGGSKGLADDEWLVGEEFDVGPEFIKRQRTEEEKWRRKVEGWVGKGIREQGCETGYEGEDWRWALRDKVEKVEFR
jgi:hypothetical protein